MDTLREFMEFGSFWTVWFWIAHVVTWSLVSHFTLGVPYDMILEANREKDDTGPWAAATEAVIRAQLYRYTTLFHRFGTALVAATAFLLSVLATLAVIADLELARALLTILGPLTLIYGLSLRAAQKLSASGLAGRALRDRVKRQRLINQMIGILAITLAVSLALWEVLRNIATF